MPDNGRGPDVSARVGCCRVSGIRIFRAARMVPVFGARGSWRGRFGNAGFNISFIKRSIIFLYIMRILGTAFVPDKVKKF